MKDVEKYKSELIGRKLRRVLHSEQITSEAMLEGLGKMHYFSTVLELTNGKKYWFGRDWIDLWDESKPLKEVTHRNWGIDRNLTFEKCEIKDIIVVDHDDIYFRLENDVVFYHCDFYGDRLYFEKYSDLFDADGNLLEG